jgi:secreted trypsin-like serine protease
VHAHISAFLGPKSQEDHMRKLGLLPMLCLPACMSPSDSRNVAGIGPGIGPGIGETRSAIVGGTTDTGDPGVVLVFAQRPGSASASLCTGEVISPHVVLTAAHCVDPATVGTGNQFSIFLGNNLTTQQNSASLWVDAASTDYDSAFDPNQLQGGHDIGVVITKTALPVTPLPVNQTALTTADQNAMLRVVGFGITSTSAQQDTSGIKRQMSTPLSQVGTTQIEFGNATTNTCEGDSGGPAFMTRGGQEVIVGITSYGDQFCQQGGVDTRVDAYFTSFIAPHIMSADGSLPMGPGPGSPDAGTSNQGSNPDSSPGVDGSSGGVDPGALAGANLALGDSCTAGNQCKSGVCTTGGRGYCTQSCDQANLNSCVAGMHCGAIGNASYCLLPDGGCSAGAGSLGAGAARAPLLLVVMFGFVGLRRRRLA